MTLLWQIIVLLQYLTITYQLFIPTSPSYIGAVVEYTPIINTENGQDLSNLNAQNYIKIIKKASEYSVDIIVFPESSLTIWSRKNRGQATSYIPAPSDAVIPCYDEKQENYTSSLINLSCAARKYHMYVVINHGEKVDCKPGSDGCPEDNFLIYNTHVTFDRNGQVIARYRKYNLFGEPGTNITSKPELSTFTTDFGVTFGQFICFDVLFEQPAVNLTRDLGVTDIVYSAHWYSELPYGFGLEIQNAWAHANDVNFLASGHNYPMTGSGGSGIFIGRHGQVHVVSENKASNILIVSEIPKKINGKRYLNIDLNKLQIYRFSKSEIPTTDESTDARNWVYQTTDLSKYNTKLIDLRSGSYKESICNHMLCCEFKLKVEYDENAVLPDTDYYRYRMLAFNDTMSFAGQGEGNTKICAVVGCLNDTLESCGRLFDVKKKISEPIIIQNLNISITRLENERSLYLPISLAKDMKPLNVSDFSFEKKEGVGYEMGLVNPKKDLLTFGIVCHLYGINNGSVGLPIFSVMMIIVLGLINRMIF